MSDAQVLIAQIRKMVGAAVAIMRGDFPLALLDATLACHSRVIVPMAPAEGLFLSRTRFFPFRTSFNRDFAVRGIPVSGFFFLSNKQIILPPFKTPRKSGRMADAEGADSSFSGGRFSGGGNSGWG